MAAIILSSLQNLKWMELRYRYIKQHTEVLYSFYVYKVFQYNIAFQP